MGWRIVRQPNGGLARFSDIVDHFTCYDMSVAEAVEECLMEGCSKEGAAAKVRAGVRDEARTRQGVEPGPNLRWRSSLRQILVIHGPGAVAECEAWGSAPLEVDPDADLANLSSSV